MNDFEWWDWLFPAVIVAGCLWALVQRLRLNWRYRSRSLPITPAKSVNVYRQAQGETEWHLVDVVRCDGLAVDGGTRIPDFVIRQLLESVSQGWPRFYFDDRDSPGELWKFEVQH